MNVIYLCQEISRRGAECAIVHSSEIVVHCEATEECVTSRGNQSKIQEVRRAGRTVKFLFPDVADTKLACPLIGILKDHTMDRS
jgi:hypothetical protein